MIDVMPPNRHPHLFRWAALKGLNSRPPLRMVRFGFAGRLKTRMDILSSLSDSDCNAAADSSKRQHAFGAAFERTKTRISKHVHRARQIIACRLRFRSP